MEGTATLIEDDSVADSNGNVPASPAGNTTNMNDSRKPQQPVMNSNTNHGVNDENNSASEQQQQQYVKGQPVILGGTIPIAAFCLLQGFFLDAPSTSSADNKTTTTSPTIKNSSPNKSKSAAKVVSVPIDRLPAMLGRTHNTTNKNFFGLGKNVKALSRIQCCIEYRIPNNGNGQIGQYSSTSKFTYQKPTTTSSSSSSSSSKKDQTKLKEEIILNPTNAIQDEGGFYVITCKGKNPIRVNGHKVDQDQTCLLTHGSVIKISSFCLYFLLPTTLSTKTMEITIATTTTTSNKETVSKAGTANSGGGVTTKKRKAPEMLLSAATAATRAIPKVASSSAAAALSVDGGAGGDSATATVKRGGGAAWKMVQDELDKKSTPELLQQLHEADENGTWDRKCQFVGGTVSYRAVMAAANSPEIQQMAMSTGDGHEGGIGKAQIIEWINASHQFGAWAQLMQSKLEPKSYQASISNAMRKAGFERSGSINFGRHVKWSLPSAFQKKSGSSGSGGVNMALQNSKRKDSGNDSDNSVANSDESDGGNDINDDDDNEVHDDDDDDVDEQQNAADSKIDIDEQARQGLLNSSSDESDNDSDSDNEVA